MKKLENATALPFVFFVNCNLNRVFVCLFVCIVCVVCFDIILILILIQHTQVKHSIYYNNLPNYFIVFDIYNKYSQTFLSRAKLESICMNKLPLVHKICQNRRFESKEEISNLLNNTMSYYKRTDCNDKIDNKPQPIEGLYIKIDDNNNDINILRCKLVRSDFIQGIEQHWMHKQMIQNVIRPFDHD